MVRQCGGGRICRVASAGIIIWPVEEVLGPVERAARGGDRAGAADAPPLATHRAPPFRSRPPPPCLPPSPRSHPSPPPRPPPLRRVPSEWKGDEAGTWSHTAGEWFSEGMEAEATGIATTDDMRHHTISAKMDKAASTTKAPLVVQFSVKHEKKDYSFCGGGYIKLHPKGFDQKKYGGDDEYAIMFGPDLCGYDVSRIHLIFNHKVRGGVGAGGWGLIARRSPPRAAAAVLRANRPNPPPPLPHPLSRLPSHPSIHRQSPLWAAPGQPGTQVKSWRTSSHSSVPALEVLSNMKGMI